MNYKEKIKASRLLKQIYAHDNVNLEHRFEDIFGYHTDFLTAQDQALLARNHLQPNQFKQFAHDDLVEEFLSLKQHSKLTFDFIKALFLKGLTGEFPRFRQAMISYLYLQELTAHDYENSTTHAHCQVCELPAHVNIDTTNILNTYYLGHTWNEMPAHFVADLTEILDYPMPKITDHEISHFKNLLIEISKADADETASQLAKRLGQAKSLPKTDTYKRYGILQSLALLGILPSSDVFSAQSTSTEITYPLSGWRGSLGVDFDKADALFPRQPTDKTST
ncbi:hypothetical protein MKI79_01400 [Acinetobacter sp. A3.8]|uniref:Uncharacterized protein n=1 Tax=Acinetobacter sedimenti TaxID=2919922 RepID=A0A9X1WXB8_9GAMM|nr:hypothetical protein [Acinetobacter sedimenti]MCJ8145577.1 hypothetical protein [Acinetobacter sedimenti]